MNVEEYDHMDIFVWHQDYMFILHWYTYAPETNTEEIRKVDTQGKLIVIMRVCMSIYDKHL